MEDLQLNTNDAKWMYQLIRAHSSTIIKLDLTIPVEPGKKKEDEEAIIEENMKSLPHDNSVIKITMDHKSHHTENHSLEKESSHWISSENFIKCIRASSIQEILAPRSMSIDLNHNHNLELMNKRYLISETCAFMYNFIKYKSDIIKEKNREHELHNQQYPHPHPQQYPHPHQQHYPHPHTQQYPHPQQYSKQHRPKKNKYYNQYK